MSDRPPLLDVPAVARRLQVRPGRIYELVRDGRLPAVRIGRQVRVCPVRLEEWIDAGGEALPGGWRAEPAA